jgi:hypothetical protein
MERSSRVSFPAEVSPLLVRRTHFAVDPCLGFVVFLQRVPLVTVISSQSESSLRASPSSRVLPNYTYLIPPQRFRSSHGLLLPTAHKGSQVYLTRVCRPATFRLQGLVTLLTVSSLPSRAGFLSHRQRSWDYPFGGFPSQEASGAFPPGSTHLPFDLAVFPAAEAPGRPDRPRFLGFDPPESAWLPAECLALRQLAPPMGFALLGWSGKDLDRDSARSPLSHFADPAITRQVHRCPRVSIDLRLASSGGREIHGYRMRQPF